MGGGGRPIFIFYRRGKNKRGPPQGGFVVWSDEGHPVFILEAIVTSHSYLNMSKHSPRMANDTMATSWLHTYPVFRQTPPEQIDWMWLGQAL